MTIQILRRNTGSPGAPATLKSGQLAWNGVDNTIYYGNGDNGSGVATAIVKIGGSGAYLLATLLGAANGVAPLDAGSKVPIANLPAAVLGALNYQGTWNASTNTPTLTSGSGTKGFYYKVSVAGTTTLDGKSNWAAGDLVAFNGTSWDAIDGTDSEVLSVAGRAGTVVLSSADLTDATTVGRALLTAASVKAQRAALKIDSLTPVADAAYTILATDAKVEMTSLTVARTLTLPAASACNVGQEFAIGDASGSCSGTNTITISRAGSDTINGGATFVLSSAYAQVLMLTDGVSKWLLVAQPAAAATTIDDGSF